MFVFHLFNTRRGKPSASKKEAMEEEATACTDPSIIREDVVVPKNETLVLEKKQ